MPISLTNVGGSTVGRRAVPTSLRKYEVQPARSYEREIRTALYSTKITAELRQSSHPSPDVTAVSPNARPPSYTCNTGLAAVDLPAWRLPVVRASALETQSLSADSLLFNLETTPSAG